MVYDQPSSACAVIAPVLYDDLKSGCTHLLTVWNRRLSGPEAVIRADAAGANDCLTIQDFNKSASAMFASSFNAGRNHSHIRQHRGYRTNHPAVRAAAEGFELSTDAFFIEKLRDVVGLYLSPLDATLVIGVDEKSQCQALERTQPMLPMGFGYGFTAAAGVQCLGQLDPLADFSKLSPSISSTGSGCPPGRRAHVSVSAQILRAQFMA